MLIEVYTETHQNFCRTNYMKKFEDLENFFSYSIIILNKDKAELLKKCIEHIRNGCKSERYEIIIGDTGSTDSETLNYYNEIKNYCKIIYLQSYNFSKNNNYLARLAQNNILLFLNNDVFVPEDFLSRLGKYFIFPKVGIVGCKLLFENQKIQHAGIEFVKEGPYKYLGFHPYRMEDSNIAETNLVKEMPAVTGACFMIEKHLFFQLGGFDEDYKSECQDTDLCLKAHKSGYKIIYSGETQAVRLENATRPKGDENWNDRKNFISRWKSLIESFLLLNRQSQEFVPRVLFIRERERGDVLATSAVIREFKKKFSSSEIYFYTKYKDLLKNNINIDKIVDYINHSEYDCVIDLTYEIGNWEEEDTWLKTLFKCAGFRKEEIDFNMQFPEFFIVRDKNFERTLPEKYIIVAPNAGWPQREWSYEKWEELVNLLKNNLGIDACQVGARSEKLIPGCKDFRGINFNQLGILTSMASFFIGVDSFPMHMAHALLPQKRNMIILTCPTSKNHVFLGEATEIRDESCEPCRKRFGEGLEVLQCKNPKIREISVRKVYDSIIKLLDLNRMKGFNNKEKC